MNGETREMGQRESVGPDVRTLAGQIMELNRRAGWNTPPWWRPSFARKTAIAHRTDLRRLLDFCGHGLILRLYRSLCRHYWDIDPAATARYVRFYRDMWDSESDLETGNRG